MERTRTCPHCGVWVEGDRRRCDLCGRRVWPSPLCAMQSLIIAFLGQFGIELLWRDRVDRRVRRALSVVVFTLVVGLGFFGFDVLRRQRGSRGEPSQLPRVTDTERQPTRPLIRTPEKARQSHNEPPTKSSVAASTALSNPGDAESVPVAESEQPPRRLLADANAPPDTTARAPESREPPQMTVATTDAPSSAAATAEPTDTAIAAVPSESTRSDETEPAPAVTSQESPQMIAAKTDGPASTTARTDPAEADIPGPQKDQPAPRETHPRPAAVDEKDGLPPSVITVDAARRWPFRGRQFDLRPRGPAR